MGYYIHQVPGRLRVKVPLITLQPNLGREVQGILESLDAVQGVSVNSITGSVIIYYDADRLESDDLLEILENHGFLLEEKERANDLDSSAGSRAGEAVGKAIIGWAVGEVLKESGLSFLAAFI